MLSGLRPPYEFTINIATNLTDTENDKAISRAECLVCIQ